MENIHSKLSPIVNITAQNISGDELEKMLSTFPKKDDLRKATDDSLYWELNMMLNRISKGEELNSPIYLLKCNSESDFFEYIVRSDAQVYYLH